MEAGENVSVESIIARSVLLADAAEKESACADGQMGRALPWIEQKFDFVQLKMDLFPAHSGIVIFSFPFFTCSGEIFFVDHAI